MAEEVEVVEAEAEAEVEVEVVEGQEVEAGAAVEGAAAWRAAPRSATRRRGPNRM